ncbi:acyl carrier protein [uncultured Olegusella sp.]|uniref:acyl carrier protein n=1 Tax=uncultured Olegusella sp. TaxID=1979846 RepID=UPI0026328A44|nr:acyl carrier protein [uncultured Olegusella sp.]
MDRSEIFDKVAMLIAETLEVDADELAETTSFNDLGADSFDMLELVTTMEDEFEVTVDEDSLGEIETIGDAVDVILKAQ